ncbi:MAG: AAA family ATPase [Thermodesulfobacteriota bacterium]|nr:AAA family ATPase [Thermodesulfobacteriota bacterium]
MYIKKLNLTSFRGASSVNLEFHKQLNVFVGMNGSGKSTILDAVAIMLSWAVNRIKHSGASGRPIKPEDIKNGQSTSSLKLHCQYDDQMTTWKLAKVRAGYRNKDERSVLQGVSELSRLLQEQITLHSGNVDLPILAYYPVNRTVLDIPLRIKGKHSFDLLSAYDESLTSGANFRTFFEWFREREDLENENRKYVNALIKPDGFQFPDPQLEAVRSALGQFMPEFKNLTVRRNPLRMEIEKNGQQLTVSQLSDGEKCLMALVGDLARRIANANPMSNKPLAGEGVVLIDEIDLHLHPKWQRLVVPKLIEVFPNCQFLISTHSPHIVTHVQPENLFLLNMTDSGLTAIAPSESYGKTVGRVLEDLMGLKTTRPDDVTNALRQIY